MGVIIGSVIGSVMAVAAGFGAWYCISKNRKNGHIAQNVIPKTAQYTQLDTLFKLPPPKND
jgi:hypothetical protein